MTTGAGLVGGNTQELHGDVIGATTLQGHSHKLHAAVCHRLSLCEAGEILLGDETPEAVGAEDEHIIIFQFDGYLNVSPRKVFVYVRKLLSSVVCAEAICSLYPVKANKSASNTDTVMRCHPFSATIDGYV